MNIRKDYYEVLEVPLQASPEEIRAAYRRLARLHHPDRNGGSKESEERFKELSEAFSVLGNGSARTVYDHERKQIQEEVVPQATFRGTVTRRARVIKKERRIYVTGILNIRYRAEQELRREDLTSASTSYKITPTDVLAVIRAEDIRHDLPAAPSSRPAFSEAAFFRTAIERPVKCTVITDDAEEHYALDLQDIRIISPEIVHTNKENNLSFGDLSATFFAYIRELNEETIETEEHACYGETGEREYKEDGNILWVRKEFYHPDCSKYWGQWEPIHIPERPAYGATNRQWHHAPVHRMRSPGCVVWSLLLFVPVLFLVPQLFFGLLAVALTCLASILFAGVIRFIVKGPRGLLRTLGGLAFLGLIYLTFFTNTTFTARSPRIPSGYDSLSTTEKSLTTPSDTTGKAAPADKLITHYIRWEDYDARKYAATVSIAASAITDAARYHSDLNVALRQEKDVARMYAVLESHDAAKLEGFYAAFDTLRSRRRMNERQLAEMIVSCIQSLPYYLVVDKDCDASSYGNDPYVANYLRACRSDCCIGHMKYGVRSPGEFASDLKGDCDTRALMLYSLLRHFNYDVALLTSIEYKHALIAVHFRESFGLSGVGLPINGRNYLLWETTAKGYRPGEIPDGISDLRYWTVTLLNTKPN